jgi:pimeloyl-ACP methyl ester carboxylesterase
MKTLFTLLLVLGATGSLAGTTPLIADIASADSVLIHAEMWGDQGPAIVLVHGWSCDSTYWRSQVLPLSLDYRVVAIDLAGHGKSGAGRKTYTMASFGQDVAAVLKSWDLRDVVLVGHSMGGAVITEAALIAPERVIGLIGVDNFHEVDMVLGEEQIAGFTAAFEHDFPGFTAKWVRDMFPATADSALVTSIANDMAAAPPAVAVSAMAELLHWYGGQAPARLALLKVPLMCINSDLEPTDEAAMKAVVPGYQVRYLANTGHFLFRDDPIAFNNTLRETLDQIEPR